MENEILYDEKTELFNSDTKMAFLFSKDRSESEYNLYLSTFKSAARYAEKDYKKDLMNFNRGEFESLLLSFQATSETAIRSRYTVLRNYILWASDEGYLGGRTPITAFFDKEDFTKYYKRVKRFLTKEELFNEILPNATNYQDAVPFILLYEGIRGEANTEICNLETEDVNFDNNTILVRGKNGDRIVHVHQDSMDIIKKAIEEEDYQVSRGEKGIISYELPKNKWVMKQQLKADSEIGKEQRSGYDGSDPIKWAIINSRVKKIAMLSGRPFLTSDTIFKSGMLNRLLEIETMNGTITNDDYILVKKEYNLDNAEDFWSLRRIYLDEFNPKSSDKINRR